MNHLSLPLKLFALVAAMMCALSANAAADVCDFSQDGIFYKIQSDGTTVHVWYEDANSWDPCYTENDYDIPETVTHSGTTYTVTGIGHTAFYGCTAVTHISLPKTLTKIDSKAFFGCSSLSSVYCHAMTPPTLHSDAFNATAYSNVQIYVPTSVTSAYAASTNWSNFQSLNSLGYHFESGGLYYNITGSNTVKVVRKDNYYNSAVYKGAIDVPATVTNGGTTYNVTAISNQAFYNCWQLTEVKIGNNVTSIANYAFTGCSSLTWVSIPAAVTSIGVGAFKSCTSLTTIICWATTPPSISSAFDGLFNQATLYVPASAVSTYQAATTWSNFSNILPIGADEAYACYTPSNTTLTFYYDTQRSIRPGTTYDLNNWPGWYDDGTNDNVTKVVFNSSFVNARPTSTCAWFCGMGNLQSITGMEYLYTSNVTDMSWMFADCEKLENLDVSHFNTAKVTNMSYMFRDCELSTSLDVSNFNTANVKTMESMFADCSGLTSLDLSNFSTANVTNMHAMFWGCDALTNLDVSHFNTAKVTDMSMMFCSCKALTNLDLSNFNTANVTNVSRMFNNCIILKSLDLSSFNTAKVTNMYWMFFNCPQLKTIYVVDGWSTAAVTSSDDMFKYCTALVGGQGTTYDENHVDAAYAHIDGGTSNPGYFTALLSLSLDEALNVEGGNLHFTTGGDYPWTVVQEGSLVYAQSSNAGVPSSSSVLTATVTVAADAEVQFDLKARGEGSSTIYDKCLFEIDGNQVFCFGGNMGTGWSANRSSLSAGTHTLTWSYIKDSSVNPDGDFFAIDNVAIIISGGLQGDANNDGAVNVNDITTMINWCLGNNPDPFNFNNANVNGDAKVDVMDVTALINLILGI